MPEPGQAECKRGDDCGEYVLDTRLGSGSYGSVWKAQHRMMADRVVAIKLFPPETEGRRIVREAQSLCTVQSPHVPQLLGGDPEANPPYIVMEFIPGESLRDLLARKGRLSEMEAVALAAQLLRGLDAAHAQGILHRDIKPENVIVQGTLSPRDALCRAVLVDFGLARVGEAVAAASIELSGGLQSAEGIGGTPIYMAPEVLAGERASPASDLFSLGILLHETLTGRRPTAVRMFTFPLEGVCRALSGWLKMALAEEPAARWKHAGEMLAAIPTLDGAVVTPLLAAPAAALVPTTPTMPAASKSGPVWVSSEPAATSGGHSMHFLVAVIGIVVIVAAVAWIKLAMGRPSHSTPDAVPPGQPSATPAIQSDGDNAAAAVAIQERAWTEVFSKIMQVEPFDVNRTAQYITAVTHYATDMLKSASARNRAGDRASGLEKSQVGYLLSWYASEMSPIRGSPSWLENRSALLALRRNLVKVGLLPETLEASFRNMNAAAQALALPTVSKLD